jgi:hypothetical protein
LSDFHHGDTAGTAKSKDKGINHGGHGEHGEKPGQTGSLLLLLSVLSVVNAFDSRRARRVAVVKLSFSSGLEHAR